MMNMQEAIEFLEDLREDYLEVEGNIGIVCDFNKVISLLQQGEKYKQMWEELNKWLSENNICGYDYHNYYVKLINKKHDIEQKYLKEAK